jgi:hypothetical protein
MREAPTKATFRSVLELESGGDRDGYAAAFSASAAG